MKTFNEIKGNILKNDENKYFLINCMELIAIENSQSQEKKKEIKMEYLPAGGGRHRIWRP